MICTVLKTTEMHGEDRVNRARKNLLMQGEDIILVANHSGRINEFVTLKTANSAMGTDYADITEAAAAYADHLNTKEAPNGI